MHGNKKQAREEMEDLTIIVSERALLRTSNDLAIIKISTMKIVSAVVLCYAINTASAFGLNSRRSNVDTSRRQFVGQIVAVGSLIPAQNANGIMTDETSSYATPSLDSSYTQQSPEGSISSANTFTAAAPRAPSDELTYTITKSELQNMKGGFGLELGEVAFRTNFRVAVKSVTANSLAAKIGIQPGWIVVSIDGTDGERTDASGVATYFSRAVKSVLNQPDGSDEAKMTLTFRDPSVFRSELQNLSADGEVSTKVAPAGDTTQRYADGTLRPGATETEQQDQVITVSQLIPPRMCNRRATTDDLIEISYIGQVLETGAIFDGSAVKIDGQDIPGRGNDVSVYLVLGKQPFGQFPPGWDVGLEGMCVGERRRLIIPPVLAYGSVGVPRRRIPPNATLQYDITLVSLNGLATPQ